MTPNEAFAVLLLTGPVGAGKTSVLGEISHVLSARGVAFAAVEMDALSDYSPRPATDPYGTDVALRNLRVLWPNFRAAGAERLVLSHHVRTEDDLERLLEVLPGAQVTVVRLRAPVQALQNRVRQRELGSGLDWHVARAAEAALLFDESRISAIVVEVADKTVSWLAEEILLLAGWLG